MSEKGNLTNLIRRLRFEHGEMTQQQLADLTGVTRQTIMALESGKYNPSLELAFRIAGVFHSTVDQIFEYEKLD